MAISAGLTAGLLVIAAVASGAPLVEGTATVIDGDTIEIRGQRIRLDAIVAPESRQQCKSEDGTSWPCGRRSAFALADMIGRGQVRCEPKGHDRYRRTIAVCFKGDTNLNALMVSEG